MMSGFGGMTGADSSSGGQQPSNFSTATTSGSESQQSNPATVPNNSSNAETNTNSSNDATSGGFSNIFQLLVARESLNLCNVLNCSKVLLVFSVATVNSFTPDFIPP